MDRPNYTSSAQQYTTLDVPNFVLIFIYLNALYVTLAYDNIQSIRVLQYRVDEKTLITAASTKINK
jgi:hypothetical protein